MAQGLGFVLKDPEIVGLHKMVTTVREYSIKSIESKGFVELAYTLFTNTNEQ